MWFGREACGELRTRQLSEADWLLPLRPALLLTSARRPSQEQQPWQQQQRRRQQQQYERQAPLPDSAQLRTGWLFRSQDEGDAPLYTGAGRQQQRGGGAPSLAMLLAVPALVPVAAAALVLGSRSGVPLPPYLQQPVAALEAALPAVGLGSAAPPKPAASATPAFGFGRPQAPAAAAAKDASAGGFSLPSFGGFSLPTPAAPAAPAKDAAGSGWAGLRSMLPAAPAPPTKEASWTDQLASWVGRK